MKDYSGLTTGNFALHNANNKPRGLVALTSQEGYDPLEGTGRLADGDYDVDTYGVSELEGSTVNANPGQPENYRAPVNRNSDPFPGMPGSR